jgi:hypothetical protein
LHQREVVLHPKPKSAFEQQDPAARFGHSLDLVVGAGKVVTALKPKSVDNSVKRAVLERQLIGIAEDNGRSGVFLLSIRDASLDPVNPYEFCDLTELVVRVVPMCANVSFKHDAIRFAS